MAWLAALLAAATLLARIWVAPKSFLTMVLVAGWAVGPAIWLFVEWFYFLRPAVISKEIPIEIVSHEQSVVRAMWAAFLIVVAATYNVIPFL